MNHADLEYVNFGDSNYFDLATDHFSNSFVHLNDRSLASKLSEQEALLMLQIFLKSLCCLKIWLSVNSVTLNVDYYSLISLPGCIGHGGSVGCIYIILNLT